MNSPGTQLYFAALVPGEPLLSIIRNIKEEFRERFGCRVALKSPAHITLLPPASLAESQIQQVRNILSQIASVTEKFSITIQNFSSFPPRVIFADVMHQPELFSLRQKIVEQAKSFAPYSSMNDLNSFHPHMTVANRDLSPENFETAWNDFSQRKIHETFTASHITLFRHNGKEWEVSDEFFFANQDHFSNHRQ